MDNYIPGMGNDKAKLLILGEAPAINEVEQGRPFVGSSGRELDKLLMDSDINRADCWVTNVSKFFVPPNLPGQKIPFTIRANRAGIDLDKQLQELQIEINQIKPNCILALGATALWALSGKTKITNYRGSIMHGMGRKFVPTYHPAHLLHSAKSAEFKGYWNRFLMVFDFKRARAQSQFAEYNIPKRHLNICKSSYELHQFYQQYHNCKELSVDIEAGGSCLPVCIGLAFNKWHGLTVPLWNCDGISDIPTDDLVNCWSQLSEILMKHDIVGQNFNYDRDKIRRLGFTIRKLHSDIMLKGFTINPELPKRLAHNQSIYTEEPFYKDEGMYEGRYDDLFLGCARDACVTFEINEAMDSDLQELGLTQFYNNFVMKLPDFYYEIEQNGFNVDISQRNLLLRKYIEWDEKIRHELYRLTDGAYINAQSPKQVAILLFDTLKCPKRDSTGEEDLTSLLNLQSFTDPTKRKIVELILENRRVRKTISTYLMALPDYDGRMKTTCFPCLETGRSSTGQQDPPIRPTIELRNEENKKVKKSLGIAFQTITKHGDIGQDVRSQYIPARGCVYVQLDKSQAEARVVFNLAEDWQALKDIDEHDYHALTASWFFGGTESDHSKKILGYESPIRFGGKTLRHMGHLGAKAARAKAEVNTNARKYKIYNADGTTFQIEEAFAKHALDTFHRKQPNIQNVFHNGVIESLSRDMRILTAPLPYGVESKCGGKRIFYERWGDELFREAFSYIPQRAVSDATKADGMRIKKRFKYCKVILESHDALVFEIKGLDLDDFTHIAKEEFEKPIDFEMCSLPRPPLVIPCEIEVGYNYQKLSKFKMREVVNV